MTAKQKQNVSTEYKSWYSSGGLLLLVKEEEEKKNDGEIGPAIMTLVRL